VSIDAKRFGTGKTQSVKVTPTSGLSQDEVDNLVKRATASSTPTSFAKSWPRFATSRDAPLHDGASARGIRELGGCGDARDDAHEGGAASRASHEPIGSRVDRDSYQELEAMTFSIAEKTYGGTDEPTAT